MGVKKEHTWLTKWPCSNKAFEPGEANKLDYVCVYDISNKYKQNS